MLDDRKAAILRAIVEEHVTTGHPVGSAAVAQKARLDVSSATVRNEMVVLEAQGYISQPHTSAGRVPTDLGYRYYVDHMGSPRLTRPDRAAVSRFFAQAHRELEEMLSQTSRMLSDLTAYAAVVVGPPPETSRIRDVHLVSLTPTTTLAVVVANTGRVEKFLLENAAADDDDLRVASERLTESLQGRSPFEPAPPIAPTGRSSADKVAARAVEAMTRWLPDHGVAPLFLGGRANLVSGAHLDEVQHILDALEKQVAVVSLLSDALSEADLAVRIGSENALPELREWSLVTAKYRFGDHDLGAVGVVGPTRMDYARAISAVEAVSAGLGAAFDSMAPE